MSTIMRKGAVGYGVVFLCICMACGADAVSDKPNIIIMVADDLGYGDVSCFGNTTLSTPNIDNIANEGAKLTHHLSASSLCGPSRAALLTGRYPIRSGMAASGNIRVNIFVACRNGMLQNETTIAELAKSVGYKTALVGKWHLGLSKDSYGDHYYHPLNQGFDSYYGHILTNMKDFGDEGDRVLNSQRPYMYYYVWTATLVGVLSCVWLFFKGYSGKAFLLLSIITILMPGTYLTFAFSNLKILNSIIYRDHEIVEQPIHLNSLMKRYVTEGIEFMGEREKDKQPFLLVLAWDHTHTALKVAQEFEGKSQHGRYGDAVHELDWGTGQIMSFLKKSNFADNTLVYFTSDNGGHLEETGMKGQVDGGYNGILKGGKGQSVVDGGIRIPSAVWYPKKIARKRIIEEPTMQLDMFTTIANLMGANIPTDRVIDGKDMFPLLSGTEKKSPQEFYFHYCGDSLKGVRYSPKTESDVWKLVYAEPNYLPGQQRCQFVCRCSDDIVFDPPRLYNIRKDPGENTPIDISSDSKYKDIVEIMKKAIENHKKSIVPVESQYQFTKMLWRPNMQPCCNFPYCSCQDEKYKHML